MPKKIWLSWSSGKDSAYALHVLRSDPTIEVVALLTTVTEGFERVSMHGVRRELLEAQAVAVDLPLVVCEIPSPCNDEEYRRRMGSIMRRAASEGIEAVAFGDLFLEDIRLYREQQLAQVGIAALFPLWGADTALLAEQMLDAGLRAVVTCSPMPDRCSPRPFPSPWGRSWRETVSYSPMFCPGVAAESAFASPGEMLCLEPAFARKEP